MGRPPMGGGLSFLDQIKAKANKSADAGSAEQKPPMSFLDQIKAKKIAAESSEEAKPVADAGNFTQLLSTDFR